jgi:hypothetical protein
MDFIKFGADAQQFRTINTSNAMVTSSSLTCLKKGSTKD